MRLRRWIFWVFVTIGVFILLSALSVYLLLRGLDLAAPVVTRGTTLSIDVAGQLPEDTLYELGSFFRVERLTFRDILESIKNAKRDSRIRNLFLQLRGNTLGWAQAEELRSALVDFRESGKSVVAYVEQAGNLEYYLATAAESIHLHPQSVLDLRGIQAEVTFMRSTLEKLGVEAEFEQIGPFKNAPDVYTRETLSESHREALDAIVSDIYDRLVSTYSDAREMSEDEMKALVDRGPFPARAALEAGLVDGLLYRDEVEETLTIGGEKYQPVTALGYRGQEDDGLDFGRSKIALIYGVGMIVPGESVDDPFVGRVMGSDTIAQAFRAIRKDDSIKAVVFRIDSPGGSDVASDIIWREASLTMKEKPVIVSMANVAASGGYWIATASDAIIAEPTTLTGSIGIYAGKFNMSGFYEKIGFNKERVMKGKSADFFSDTRNFTEDERQRFRAVLEEGYRRFLEKVSEARGKEESEVHAIAQGRVWTGAQALENGLVDELGGLDRAVALAKEKAGIPESSRVNLELYPRKKSLIEAFIGQMIYGAPEILSQGGLERQGLMARSPVLRMLMEGQRLAVMPYQVELH